MLTIFTLIIFSTTTAAQTMKLGISSLIEVSDF
jgi:hypothetical protein